MSVRAIKTWLAPYLDGLTVPTIPAPLRVRVQPRSIERLTTPLAWIWIGESQESRLGGPRGQPTGKRRVVHQLMVEVAWDIAPASNDPQAFDDLVNAVLWTLRRLPISGVVVTDPITHEQSQLLVIGEDLRVIQPLPDALTPQGDVLRYLAQVITPVEELLSA